MKRSKLRTILLHGAIRRDRGNGLRFYDALRDASVATLKMTLLDLNAPFARSYYSFWEQRKTAIEKRLAEVTA